jgi:hypothetical protein
LFGNAATGGQILLKGPGLQAVAFGAAAKLSVVGACKPAQQGDHIPAIDAERTCGGSTTHSVPNANPVDAKNAAISKTTQLTSGTQAWESQQRRFRLQKAAKFLQRR